MAKRIGGSDEEGPLAKRRKTSSNEASKKCTEEIQSSQDLQRLLAFEQDTGSLVKQKIQAFKSFLDFIAYSEESEPWSTKKAILLDYLKSQVAHDDEDSSAYLADIIQTWHFSAQANNEGLFSAVVAVLALLLKTISSFVEFRRYGNLLGRTLLQKEQIKLVDRGLSAKKPKEHVVSPCLRLMTEIVSFDGGNAAKNLYLHRDVTFKHLDLFLGMRKDSGGTADDRKPSVRNNALRYLFANLRMQDHVTKIEILAQGRTFRAVLQDIREDSPTIVQGILDTLKKEIVENNAISPLSKSRLFTDSTLRRLAMLYSYHEDDRNLDGSINIEDSVHAFLLQICTNVEYGVLIAQSPPRTDAAKDDLDTGGAQEMISISESYRTLKPIKNRTLSSFLQALRPYSNVHHHDLALAIFQAAPELIADYFHKQKRFSFEPKLTATWIGYSRLLMSTVQLPIPKESLQNTNGTLIVSPIAVLIESILPQPLTKKVLTRCINQSAGLITFFAMKILVLAFEKLGTALKTLKSADQDHQDQSTRRGEQAALALIAAFCQRCPDMKYAIAVFRSCAKEKVMLREAITRLLALYYEFLPQVALDNRFDISVALSVTLQEHKLGTQSLEGPSMQSLELGHLLNIAHRSPDMNWWHKMGNMLLSPFTTVLRLYVDSGQMNAETSLRVLLQSMIKECAFLNPNTHISSLNVLVLSLKESQGWKASDTIYEFLDNCVLRFVRKPVKYYDNLTHLLEDVRIRQKDSRRPDLLFVVILEQWPFLVKSSTASDTVSVAQWLARYLDLSAHAGGDFTLLSQIRDRLNDEVYDKDCHAVLRKAVKEPVEFEKFSDLNIIDRSSGILQDQDKTPRSQPKLPSLPEKLLPPGPLEEDEDHAGLRKWAQKDVRDAIADGSVEDLIFCLCSKHEEIRKQALNGLRTFMAKLEPSGYSEWQQTYVLVGEIIEIATNVLSQEMLPSLAVVIAARSLSILADPLHVMYTKINKFLNKGPQWNVARLPSYWVDRVLLHPPTDDEGHYEEVRWMLEILVDGLRTPADMEIYRRCHILERLLSMTASPSLPEKCSERVMQLLFRCTYVGGSTTLITRCGLLSWIDSRLTLKRANVNEPDVLRLLASRVYETTDKERVDNWSKQTFVTVLDSVHISGNK